MKYVVCLCGSPGAGKSSFAHLLCGEMKLNFALELQPEIVSYDEVSKNYIGKLSFKEIRSITMSLIAEKLKSDSCRNVIIVDDTMHYHSMRRELYACSRDSRAAMRVVWLRCDVEVAVERDNARDATLGEETVRKVHSMFEAPREEYIWERGYVTVDTTDEV
ncbi:unnamed protein product, partial [Ectocarpus fasciculatus]